MLCKLFSIYENMISVPAECEWTRRNKHVDGNYFLTLYWLLCVCVCEYFWYSTVQTFSLTIIRKYGRRHARELLPENLAHSTHLEIFIMLSRDVFFFLIRFHSILKRCHLFFLLFRVKWLTSSSRLVCGVSNFFLFLTTQN